MMLMMLDASRIVCEVPTAEYLFFVMAVKARSVVCVRGPRVCFELLRIDMPGVLLGNGGGL